MVVSENEDSGTVLVVDDDARLRELLSEYLSSRGFTVTEAIDGTAALASVNESPPDLVVLDIMMPGIDGLETLRRLRQFSQVPVIMLTARGEDTDRIVGLELGADDYLPKPFEPKELGLRMEAILRRANATPPKQKLADLRLGSLRFDVERGELWRGEQAVRLTTAEVALMKLLARRVNEPVSRMELLAELGGQIESETGATESATQERAVDVQITRLRKKVEETPREPRFIKTVRGAGYMLAPDAG